MKEFFINPCSGMAADVKSGQLIKVIDVEGQQVVDFFAEVSEDEREFLSTGVTIDVNSSLRLRVGDLIYTNLYRPMLEIVADDVGEHDLLYPCCRPEMYEFRFKNGDGHPNCHDNINKNMGENRPIINAINLFMKIRLNDELDIVVEDPISKAGDSIVFIALMDMKIGVASCSVSETNCNGGICTPAKIIIADSIGEL